MNQKQLDRKEEIKNQRIYEMSMIKVQCLDRSRTLWDLCQKEKVVKRIEYVCNIGRPTHKIENPWIVEKKRHNIGFVFGDGFEIKGVSEKHFNFFSDVSKEDRWERV